MTSLYAVPLQILSITCEVLFILENKLHSQRDTANVPSKKCDMIIEDVATTILDNVVPSDLFRPHKAMVISELRKFFLVANHDSMRFEAEGFEKLFRIACMAVKVQLLRVDHAKDLARVLDCKLLLIQNMFANPMLKDEIGRTRSAIDVFYGALNCAELDRVRRTLLNSFRLVCVPVSILINEGIQLESGHIIPRKSGANSQRLGSYLRFQKDGSIGLCGKLALAASERTELESANPVVGENLFSFERVAANFQAQHGQKNAKDDFFEVSSRLGGEKMFDGALSSAPSRSSTMSFTE